jgi:type I restriction enzyme S subunit
LEDVAGYSKDRINCSFLTEKSYVSVENLLQNRAGKKDSERVPSEGNVIGFNRGDVLIGNIRPYLKKIWLADCNGGTNGDVLTIRSKDPEMILPQYLYCILASDVFFDYDNSNSKGAKMPRGDKSAVMQYRFCLPSIETQKKISSILDRFDALCNDISSGLLAEIEARQKQYEYYRDKLLTFKELSV